MWYRLLAAPWWMTTLLLFIMSPAMMWVIDILVVQGYVVPLSYQWYAAWLGDSLLAVAMGLMVLTIQKNKWSLPSGKLLHAAMFIPWAGVALFNVWIKGYGVIVWLLDAGPNDLYHAFIVFPVLGYMFTILASAPFVNSEWPHRCALTFLFAIGLMGVFGGTWAYDLFHPYAPDGIPKSHYASPLHPWCGGFLTRDLC